MGSVTKTIVVRAPISTVFNYWKNFENFPRFMENIESIRTIGPDLTHWKSKGPLGTSVEWDAETTYIEENKKIAWKSVGGQIETHGAVIFKELDAGRTEVTVGIEYNPPVGALGEAVAKLFSDPEKQLDEDLERFRRVVEGSGYDDATVAHGTPGSTYSSSASLDEADIDGAHDASREDSDVDAVAGVRS